MHVREFYFYKSNSRKTKIFGSFKTRIVWLNYQYYRHGFCYEVNMFLFPTSALNLSVLFVNTIDNNINHSDTITILHYFLITSDGFVLFLRSFWAIMQETQLLNQGGFQLFAVIIIS